MTVIPLTSEICPRLVHVHTYMHMQARFIPKVIYVFAALTLVLRRLEWYVAAHPKQLPYRWLDFICQTISTTKLLESLLKLIWRQSVTKLLTDVFPT